MADRRRRSPEGSVRTERTRKGSRRSVYDEPPRMRSNGAEELSSSPSSSSSSSYLDISRSFPPNKSGFLTFFTAPSERRKLRKRRSSRGLFKITNSSSSSLDGDLAYGTGFIKRSKRSVRSRKGKEIDRERYSDRYSDRERDKYKERDRHSDRERPSSGIGKRPGSGIGRAATDAEILAVGAGLAALAREQNKLDLKAARNGKKPEVIAARETSFGQSGTSRGLGPSKVSHASDTLDEDGWESASDDESDTSVDSALAFNNDINESKWKHFFGRRKYKPKSRKSSVVDPRLFGPENSLHGVLDGPVGFGDVSWNSSSDFGQGSFSFVPSESVSASQSQQSLMKVYPVATEDTTRYEVGRGSVVSGQYTPGQGPPPSYDPRTDPRADPRYEAGRGSVVSGQYAPRQGPPPGADPRADPRYEAGRGTFIPDQYTTTRPGPGPVQDFSRYQEPSRYQELSNAPESSRYQEPSRFQDARDSAISGAEPSYISMRPEPIPLQQPQPITPVSQSIFEPAYAARSESGGILKKASSTPRTSSLAQAALVGVAGVTAGAAIASARDDRKDRRREEELELERDRLKRRDSEKESKDDRRREKRSSSDREDKKEKSREKDKKRDNKRGDSDEKHRDKEREKRRDQTRGEKDERREKRREERRSERTETEPRAITESVVSASTAPVDPFIYQVRDDIFPTPTVDSSEGHRKPTSAPSIITVEREPDFTRKRNYSTKDQTSIYEPPKEYSPPEELDRKVRDREERDRPLHRAEEFYEESKHSTAPYDAAIMTSAIAAVVTAEEERKSRSERRREERRGEKRDEFGDYSSEPRDKEPEKERDPIQEEADRAYREIVMARKIASQVIRQRTPSPNRSVVDKYKDESEEEVIKIVTPPEMADQKKKGPYDAPNADFRPDYEFQSPTEVTTFAIPEISMSRSLPPGTLPKRDPDTSRPRPILNLVRPTPTPSPAPEKQTARSEPSRRRSRSKDGEKRVSTSEVTAIAEQKQPTRSTSSDVVIGPKGNVVENPTPSTISKAVTWGENETKHYEVESPSDHRDEFISGPEVRTREVPEEIKQSSSSKTRGWGALAGAIMGVGAGAAAAAASGDSSSKSSKSKENEKPEPFEYRGVTVEPDSPPQSRKSSPPPDQRQPSPPAPGPKPRSSQSTHMPGSFDDDIEFTAAVAAGLGHTGFDPDIVINDPTFRRRDSPPGSNDAPIYRSPFAETVSDLGTVRSELSGAPGFVIGEVASTPQDWRSTSPPREEETPVKLSKREQRKLDKARRQSSDVTPVDEPIISREIVDEPDSYFVEPKISKKEQKKRDKEAQRQLILTEDVSPPFEPSVSEQIVAEPESYFETPKKSKKKSKNGSSSFNETPEELSRDGKTVSVPVDAYVDVQNGDDDWTTETKKPKKSRRDGDQYDSPARSVPSSEFGTEERSSSKKSKRDSGRYDSPTRSVPSSEVGTEEKSSSKKSKRDSVRYDSPARSEVASEVGSSKKSRDKSKRRSESYDVDPTEVSLPPSTPSETSEFDESRRTRKSDSGIFSSADRGESRSLARSVVSAGASRYDDDEPRKSKKKSRSSTKDDFDDSRSVASAPAGDEWEDSKKSKKKDKEKDKKSSGFFGLFSSKSDVITRDESPKELKDDGEDARRKKKKRSSTTDSTSNLYSGAAATSVSDLSRSMSISNGKSNGNGSNHDYDAYEDGTRSDGEREKKKSRSRSESTSSKKGSFLGNTGTLGAGVGIAGAAVAIAAQQYQQSKAASTNDSEKTEFSRSMNLELSSKLEEALDPDIQHRVFRPSIDPQYGDLLPLPPSGPTSPNVEPIDELPGLPDSRPVTPEADHVARERAMSAITSFRKSQQETPIKSPSQSAVPVRFLRDRSTPPSPVAVRSSPMQSPAALNQEPLGFSKHKARPTSWQGKEFRPLYLVESHRRGSSVQLTEAEESPLPPSQATSRSSSQHDFSSSSRGLDESMSNPMDPLSIDTALARSASPTELLNSQQSTPKAAFYNQFDGESLQTPRALDGDYDLPSERREGSSGPPTDKALHISGEDVAAGIAIAGLAAGAGYLLSSHMHEKAGDVDDLPLTQPQPAQVDPVTKDRSSYLLKFSPISRNFDDIDTDSPIRQPELPSPDRNTLHSIDEQGAESPSEYTLPEDIQRQRERALESLSGAPTPQDELTEEAALREILEAEPSDVFSFTRSKKSKKDKRKSKGLSRSSTQDDLSAFAESSAETVPEQTVALEKEPTEEALVKSKADKKKNKKKGKSFLSWDDPEDVKQQPEEYVSQPSPNTFDPLPVPPSLFPDRVERTEESATSLPKGNKGKSIAQSDEPQPEEETGDEFHDALDETTSRDASELISAPDESQQDEELFTPTSKKDKKRDKKKLKSVSPELADVALPLATSTESQEDVFEDAPALIEKPVEDYVPSKSKNAKKDKKKSKSVASWDDVESVKSQPVSDTPRDIVEDVPEASERQVDDFSFIKTSKKDKKKQKSKSSFETETQPSEDPVIPESSREIIENLPVVVEQPANNDFSSARTSNKDKKKDKKKRKSQSNFEPAASLLKSPLPEPSQDISEEPASIADKLVVYANESDSKETIVPKSENDGILSEPVSLEVHHLATEETSSSVNQLGKSEDFALAESKVSKEEITDALPLEVPPEDLPEDKTHDVQLTSNRELGEEAAVSDEFASFAGKKSKKKKRKSGLSWELEENVTPTESTSEVAEPDLKEEVLPDTAVDDFAIPETKKGQKNKGKSISGEELVEEPSATSTPQESEDPFEFTKPVSKKDKKKGKKAPSAILDDRASLAQAVDDMGEQDRIVITEKTADDKPLEDVPQSFMSTGSKKSKKFKKSKFLDFDPEPTEDQNAAPNAAKDIEGESAFIPEAFEEVTTTKKGRKKSKKPEASDVIEEVPPAVTTSDDLGILDIESTLPASETPIPQPTPMGGPGAWPITPVTPFTGGEAQGSATKGYFPSAAALLPTAAVGVALLATESLKQDEPMPVEATNPKVVDIKQSEALKDNLDSEGLTPDGLKAGYKDEQLSLARQLQEEFASGSKKSKRDKKKRQSLPSTPDRQPSRSRAIDDLVEDHHRARSLSTGPSAERSGESPANTERANIYTEDQLELARQLKAEFESKKSKKEKKGRKGRSLTQDNEVNDQDFEQPQATGIESSETQQPELPGASPKGDGFAAGYQEDQLSLARQLQAEFGSGSKKSRKDKKRRSTSQTPLEQNPADDYFGDVTQSAEPLQLGDSSNIQDPTVEQATPVRDGLAAGYNEDQLELARQLKEEFAAKKSKKDKKDKKRQSLLRGSTEDDFLSDAPVRGSDEPSNFETLSVENPEELGVTLPTEPEGDLPVFDKKSKKDKKNKKRGSLLRSTTDEDLGAESFSRDISVPSNEDSLPQSIAEESVGELAAVEPEEELVSSKKSRKDKKGKKRESLVPDEADEPPTLNMDSSPPGIERTEPDFVQDTQEVELEDEFASTKKSKKDKKNKKRDTPIQFDTEATLPSDVPPTTTDSESSQLAFAEGGRDILPVELADDFALTKKSKKDKKGKKRESLAPEREDDVSVGIPLDEQEPGEQTLGDSVPASTLTEDPMTLTAEPEELADVNEGETSRDVPEESYAIAEPQQPLEFANDDFDLPTKKSKKGKKSKKRESLVPENSSDAVKEETSRDLPEESADIPESQPAEPAEDSFDFPMKRSKKEKKKRHSMAAQDDASPQLENEVSLAPEDPIPDTTATSSATEVIDEPFDEFSASKKSKKDKKKRQSLLRSLTLDEKSISKPLPEENSAEPESQGRDLAEPASSTLLEDDQSFSFESGGKKSKKDKKKRKSTQQDAVVVEEPSPKEPEPNLKPAEGSVEELMPEQPVSLDEPNLEEAEPNIKPAEVTSEEPAPKKPVAVDEGSLEPAAATVEEPVQEQPVSLGHPASERVEPSLKLAEVAEGEQNLKQPTVSEQPASIEAEPSLKLAKASAEEQVPDQPVSLDQPASQEAENPDNLFGEYAFSKKSKKDKKKRKGSTKTDSAEASGNSTPLDPLSEAADVPLAPQDTAEKSITPEPLETISEKAVLAEETAPAPAKDELGSISRKNSKKGKGKGKKFSGAGFEELGSAIPLEADQEPIIPTLSTEPTSVEPSRELDIDSSVQAATQESIDEPLDEWEPTKKSSKKDKKRKSKVNFEDLPSEPISEAVTPAFSTEPTAVEQSIDVDSHEKSIPPEPINEPLDTWEPPKKSKKDKKARKDSSKAVPEDIPSASIEPFAQPVDAIIPSLSTQSTVFDPSPEIVLDSTSDPNPEVVDEPLEEWGSAKKSKKDKKKRKNSPKSNLDEPVLHSVEPTISESLEETTAQDNAETSRPRDIVESAPSAPQDLPEEPQEEFVLSRKNSKKAKKNKKGSKVDFESETISTPLGTKTEAEPSQDTSLPIEQPLEHDLLEEQPRQDLDISRGVDLEAPVEETLDERAPTKKSKKDERNDSAKLDFEEPSGTSAPLESVPEPLSEAAHSLPPAEESSEKEILEHAPEPDLQTTSVEEVSIETFNEYAPVKKSKKDKKKKKGSNAWDEDTALEPSTSQPYTEATETLSPPSEPAGTENIEQEPEVAVSKDLSADDPANEPFDEWAPAKKSKKDKKKRKSGLSTPAESATAISAVAAALVIPSTESTAQSSNKDVDLETTEQQVDTAEPEDEWGSALIKKSKKDKKRKSGVSTPFEEISESSQSPLDEQLLGKTETTHAQELSSQEPRGLASNPGESIAKSIDEWDSASTKNSKKDKKKRKSMIPTPSEEILGPSQPSVDKSELLEEVPPTLDEPQELPNPETKDTVLAAEENTVDPADDGGSVPVKKSKKDKKRKSSLSTPVEELTPKVQPSVTEALSSHETKEAVAVGDNSTEVADEWDAIPMKKSKKDKKLKSGVSTPTEEVVPEIRGSLSLEPAAETPIREIVDEPEDEWAGAVTKKSKKDKKKRKSGTTTPLEPVIIPEAPSSSNQQAPTLSNPSTETSEIIGGPLDQEPAIIEGTKEDNLEPDQEWGGAFESRNAKKDKKKRKSGLSAPIGETLPIERAASQGGSSKPISHPGPIDLFHGTSSSTALDSEPQVRDQVTAEEGNLPEAKSLDSTVQGTQSQEFPVEEAKDEDATDDPFAFVTKRSKKEKKGKRASKVDSESEPSTSFSANVPLPVEKDEPSTFESEPLATSFPSEEAIPKEPELLPSSSENVNTDTVPDEEQEIEPTTVFRKGSKKEKRKRQPTIDASTNELGSVPPPMTTWADEVEEAQVVRDMPVIEEIAKDESLSRIPITSPTDDFVRPSKKSKKAKRKESLSEPNKLDHPPIGPATPSKDSEDKSTHVPIIALGAAAITGAALLHKAGDSSASSSSITPARKLSKKEKRKMSIDKREPKEDMFDDPALWEGADPMVYEETKEGEDDAGSDGFWSAPQKDIVEPTAQESREPPILMHDAHSFTDGQVDTARALAPPFPAQPELHSSLEQPTQRRLEKLPETTPAFKSSTQNQPSSLEQSDDIPDEFFAPSSKEDKKKNKSKSANVRNPAESISNNQAPLDLSGPSGTVVEDPPANNSISFDEAQPVNVEHISTSSRDISPHNPFQRRALSPEIGRNSPTIPRTITPRSSRPRLSDLPIVHEENLAQVEAEHRPKHHSHLVEEANRDSGFLADSPIPPQRGFTDHDEHVRDSGIHLQEGSPAGRGRAPLTSTDDALARLSWPSVDEDTETVDLHRSQRPTFRTPKKHLHEEGTAPESHDSKRSRDDKGTDLSSSQREEDESPILGRGEKSLSNRGLLPSQMSKDEPQTNVYSTPAIHGRKLGEGSLIKQRMQKFESPDLPKPNYSKTDTQTPEIRKLDLRKDDLQRTASPKLDQSQTPKLDKYRELNSSPRPTAEKPQGISDIQAAGIAAGVAIAGASLGFAAGRKISQEKRPESAQGQKSTPNINRLRTPDIKRTESAGSNRSGTPPLRRTDRQFSGDLRSLSQRSKTDLAKEAELAAGIASSVNTSNPTANEGRARAKNMADVYDGFGEGRMGSPRSPTRPHSMRRRQSMQVLDLEQKVEQLAAENRMLADAKAQAERTLMSSQHASSSLVEKDAEIDSLKRTLEWLQNEVGRLKEVNEGLTSANVVIARQHSDRYGMLESQHAALSRELQETRDAHNNLSAGMDGIVQNEVQTAVLEKDRLIAQLRAELDTAKEKIREMQREMQKQILSSKTNDVDFLTIRDEDYFDNACQQLCQHVQQWVLRFSKFSDMRACRLTSEINNDKTIDRLDNAILDGSDVDSYLADRVKRRDVFMSMTMTMVWEFIFTRYLFGMDREQRQKLKSLEKLLSEVGPQAAVHQWRATTLTLLSKRPSFTQQREQDTQAVVHAILETLSEILPPPSHLEAQIEEQLMRVMKSAVDLSIEMRTQRAEYMMLPPLQPEYDANGDLASKVSFNSALMNERSGDTVSNEDLETQKAVVRIVLFPLVVKKGDDRGEGDEEIVVCPAQVLVAKAKKARFMDGTNHSRVSMQSSMPAGDDSVI